MDDQRYFQELLNKYPAKRELRLMVSSTSLEQPCQMDGNLLIIDGTKHYHYEKVIKEFLIFHLIEELEINTETISIKSISLKDLSEYYELVSNPVICDLDASMPVESKNEALRRLMSARINGKGIYIEDTFVGFIGMSKDQSRASVGIEIGYSIIERYWHRGIASLAISLLTESLLDSMPVDLVSARVLEENIASKRVLEKSGFELEGIRKQSLFHPMRKQIISTIVYSKEKRSIQ